MMRIERYLLQAVGQINLVKEAMMRMSKLIPLLTLLFLFSVPFATFVGEAHADCCMCGWGCYDFCTCPGTWPCAGGCAADDQSQVSQSNPLPTDTVSNITIARESVPSLTVNSYGVDRLIRRIGTGLKIGQCAQNTFRLNIVDGDSSLKLGQIFLKENLMQENAVVFQIAKNGGK